MLPLLFFKAVSGRKLSWPVVENNLFESELIEKRIKDTISTTIHQPVKYVIPVKKLSRNRIGKKQRKEMKERYEKGEFEDYIKKIEARNF